MLLTEVQNAKMGEAGRQMLLAPGSKGENRGGGEAEILVIVQKANMGEIRMRTFRINFGWRART